jgi:hypothetical protein
MAPSPMNSDHEEVVGTKQNHAVSACKEFCSKTGFHPLLLVKDRFFVKCTARWRKQVSRTVSDLTKGEEEVYALRRRLSVAEGLLRL